MNAQQKPKNGECTLPVTVDSSSLSAIHSPDTKTKQKTMENKNLKRITKITYPALALLALACFALSPKMQAVVPAPDGGYIRGNTAEGDNALFGLSSGSWNTATGFDALYSNSSGNFNTAIGSGALYYNTFGYYNTASGVEALNSNTTGSYNTANGYRALVENTTGSYNTANGNWALYRNTTGIGNTANGSGALFNNNAGGVWNTNGSDYFGNSASDIINSGIISLMGITALSAAGALAITNSNTVNVAANGSADVNAVVSGNGTFSIGDRAELEFGNSVAKGQTVSFVDGHGLLVLDLRDDERTPGFAFGHELFEFAHIAGSADE